MGIALVPDVVSDLVADPPRRRRVMAVTALAGVLALAAPKADASTRQMAQVGIGHVYRAQALLATNSTAEVTALRHAALTNYLEVIFPTREGEEPDPFWLREATFNAAGICETQGEWEKALNLYTRLAERVPSLKEAAAKKIESIQKQLKEQRL